MKSMYPRVALFAVLLPIASLAVAADVDPASPAPAPVEQPAPAAPAAEAPVAAPVQAEAAPAAGASSIVGVPPQNKGQIVFFRPSRFVGGAIGFKVREGETELGKLNSGKYFVVPVEPGAHQYTVHSEAKDILNLEVEAGETYYVQGTISMGVLAGRPNLAPSTQAEFEAMSSKLKPAKPLK